MRAYNIELRLPTILVLNFTLSQGFKIVCRLHIKILGFQNLNFYFLGQEANKVRVLSIEQPNIIVELESSERLREPHFGTILSRKLKIFRVVPAPFEIFRALIRMPIRIFDVIDGFMPFSV